MRCAFQRLSRFSALTWVEIFRGSVTSAEFRERLQARAEIARLTIAPETLASLETYYLLLTHWNARINLTALELQPLSEAAADRLFVEPLAAATMIPELPNPFWFDLGSGGGSPALPMLIASPSLRLTMVESRERKAAFLREAVRALNLTAEVVASRFEDLGGFANKPAGLITARAIRVDGTFFEAATSLLCNNGVLALFNTTAVNPHVVPAPFATESSVELLGSPGHHMTLLRHVPRGTT
jgi:16S rRNA (guanine527-N7)-methyltransferase